MGRFRLGDFDGGPALASNFDERYSELFIAANRLDDADAMLQFAQLLRERGDLGAIAWMRRACRKRHPLACMHLAEIFFVGELGVVVDWEKAEELRAYAMALIEHIKSCGTAGCSETDKPELPLCLRCR